MQQADSTFSSDAPIGVFDSGFGGLSVLQHLRDAMPREQFIYFADSAHLPYGDKRTEYIQARIAVIGRFLIAQHCKAIVIACNTATAAAAETLRGMVSVPVIAIEPAIKPAALQSRAGKVGVLATEGTIRSERLAGLVNRFSQGIQVYQQPCPGLAEQVEKGELNSPETRALLQTYLTPMQQAGVDTLVLGCTHYPFLRDLIVEIMGYEVSIIDAGEAVARQTMRRLMDIGGLAKPGEAGRVQVYTSAAREMDSRLASRLLSTPLDVIPVAV